MVSTPYLSHSRWISRSATAVASAWACMSPITSPGLRVFDAIILATSSSQTPLLQTRVGVMRRPSPMWSSAVMLNEPGVAPPMSAQCPLAWE